MKKYCHSVNFCNLLASQDISEVDPSRAYKIKNIFAPKYRDLPTRSFIWHIKDNQLCYKVTVTLKEHSISGTLEYNGDNEPRFQNQHLQRWNSFEPHFFLFLKAPKSSAADDVTNQGKNKSVMAHSMGWLRRLCNKNHIRYLSEIS